MIIKPNSFGAFIRSLSGLFITKNNPGGITPKECTILAALLHILSQKESNVVTKEVKEELANMTNHSMQVITNYINKFKKKGVLLKDSTPHSILTQDKITIEWTK